MIGAISASSGYTRLQWPSYAASGSKSTAAENHAVTAVHRHSEPETPVQPVDTAKPVTSEASGNLSVDPAVRDGVDVAEMAVRMRISPEPSNVQTQETSPQDALKTEEEERQARMEERVQMEKEAEAEREAYMEALAEAEEAREQRIESLREAQAEENGTGEETEEEKAVSSADEKGEETQQTGFLELDHTAALLRNYQMTNLLHDQLAARAKGEDTTGYNAAMDAIFQNSQNRVRFVSGDETDNRPASRQAYQQLMNDLLPGVAA